MAIIKKSTKAASVNPLKMSPPLGACYAFLGMKNCMPMMHGSQGCASLGLVLLVRHFREAIPLQTTAMSEVTSILGGHENLERAVLNIRQRAHPELIAICSTGLTETRGDDVAGHLQQIRRDHPELVDTGIVQVSTPDYVGAFQDGWAKAVLAMIQEFTRPSELKQAKQVNVLAGCHLTPGDIEEVREIIESFGLHAIILPDLSGSLDGHMSDEFSATTMGGTSLSEVATMGQSVATIAIGEQMYASAIELEMRTGVPYVMFDRLTGLSANDRFLTYLAQLSGEPVAAKYRRQRSQLQDAMLDAHFFFGGKKVAIAAEPDLLWALSMLLTEMGCTIECAISTTTSPVLERVPVEQVLLGDLEDLELGAKECDLIVTHSHGRQAAERLGIPFYRAGLPMFDRLGAAHQLSVGYRGTCAQIFSIGNLFLANAHAAGPGHSQLAETSAQALAEMT